MRRTGIKISIIGFAMIVAGFFVTDLLDDSVPNGMSEEYYKSYGELLSVTHNTGLAGIPILVCGIILAVYDTKKIPYPFFVGISSYGIITGIYLAVNWNDEGLHILLNVPSMLLGDSLHSGAIDTIGDPRSDRAFYTVPWVLRQPFVYIVSSILIWVPLGFAVQSLIDCKRNSLSHIKNKFG